MASMLFPSSSEEESANLINYLNFCSLSSRQVLKDTIVSRYLGKTVCWTGVMLSCNQEYALIYLDNMEIQFIPSLAKLYFPDNCIPPGHLPKTHKRYTIHGQLHNFTDKLEIVYCDSSASIDSPQSFSYWQIELAKEMAEVAGGNFETVWKTQSISFSGSIFNTGMQLTSSVLQLLINPVPKAQYAGCNDSIFLHIPMNDSGLKQRIESIFAKLEPAHPVTCLITATPIKHELSSHTFLVHSLQR